MHHKLLKNTAIVGGMTLLSRVLGLVRDMVLARLFGANAGMDAFFVAFKIPNFLRRLFAEGAFSQAFVPIISEYREQRDHASVQQLVNKVGGTLLGVLTVVSVIGVLASPLLVMLFAPGFLYRDPAQFDLAALMLRMTFPYILFISLVAFAAGILNTYGRFAASSFVPVWLNIVLIGAAILVAPHLAVPELALAGAVFIAGVLQLLFLLPSLKRVGLFPRPSWGRKDEGVRRILKLMLPGIIGSSVAQINLLFDTLVASFLVAGSVSWLYYSDRLMEFPLGVFAIALSTVILPSLSRSHANDSLKEFSHTVDWGLRLVMLVGIPSAIGLFMLARPLLVTLFNYGDFGATDVSMSSLSLMAYATGLPAFMLIKVLAPAFYSRKDTTTPVRIAVVALLTNVVLNIAFVVPMVKLDIPGPHAGLALATSVAAWVNAGLLYYKLKQHQVYQPAPGWWRLLLQLAFAGTALTAVLVFAMPATSLWQTWPVWSRVTGLLLWVGVGMLSYFIALHLSGLRLKSLLQRPDEA